MKMMRSDDPKLSGEDEEVMWYALNSPKSTLQQPIRFKCYVSMARQGADTFHLSLFSAEFNQLKVESSRLGNGIDKHLGKDLHSLLMSHVINGLNSHKARHF